MANNIKKILPTDIISDSMDKINSNFDILSSYSVFSDKSLTEYYKKINDIVNGISGKIDVTESRLNSEFEKIRGEITEYNDNVSSINQTADEISTTVSKLNKKFDGTVEDIQSKFTQSADRMTSTVESYRNENTTYQTNINKILDKFQDQIDGNIETWYYDGEPTMGNEPVITWIKDVANEEEKNKTFEKHQGDLYYDRTTGFAYRFFKSGDAYEWKLIRDYEITEMLGKINQKSKIFTSQPEPPYNVGDMWINDDNDLFVCKTQRDSGIWSRDDWDFATRYKADLDEFKKKYQTEKEDLQNQIDGKIQYWFQENDPSIDWTTDIERNNHINDLWYNSNVGITKVYVKTDFGYKWQKTTDKNLENLAQSAKDGNITIFYGDIEPSGYKKGDLWYDCTYPVGTTIKDNNNKYYHDTLRCQTTQGESSFAINHWVPINGGDKAFSRISQGVSDINLEVFGSSEDGKDALRTLINQRVTIGELEEAKTSITNKIDTEKSTILAKFDSYATNDKVNGIQSAVDNLNTQINDGESSIVSKLNQTATKDDVNKVQLAVTNLTNTVNKNNEDISASLKLKAESSELDKTNLALADINTQVGTTKTTLSQQATEISGIKTAIASIKTTADNAASKLELKSVSDKATANEISITNLTTEINGTDGKSGLKAGLENAVSRIGANEKSISGLTAKIGDDNSGIISQINAQATDIAGVKTAQTKMQSSIDGHTASIKTMVTKDEMNNILSNITIDADRININAEHKLSIKSSGLFELISANCTIDANGNITATNANISGNITTNTLIAETDKKKTEINGDKFEISTKGGDTSTISITIVDDMKNISGYGDAPTDLQTATNVPTLCMEYKGTKYYLWPGAWKTINSGNSNDWTQSKFFEHNTYKSLGGSRFVSSLSSLTTVLDSHLNSRVETVVPDFLEEIGTYFICSDAVSLTSGNNLEKSYGAKVYNMTDLLTGMSSDGVIYSGQTDQPNYNYLPTIKKYTNYTPQNTDTIWETVKSYYTDFADGAYVQPGKKCNTVMVSEAYDYAEQGEDLMNINSLLGINVITDGYILDPYSVNYSSLRVKQGNTNIDHSSTGSSFGINLYTTVCDDIAATGTTDDEKTIKTFVGNTSSKTNVSSSGMGGEMTVLCYPLYNINYGSISNSVKKCMYVLVVTGYKRMTGMDNGWQGYDGTSGNYAYGTRRFYLTYLIDNEPYYNDSGLYFPSSTTVATNKKKILAKLINKLGTRDSRLEFTAKISTAEHGQTFSEYTLFDGVW